MNFDRRRFVQAAAIGTISATVGLPLASAATMSRSFKAVAFDAFPIFDPRPVFALAETLFPGKGVELTNAWRTRQFEYQWLHTLSGRYADFWQTTQDGLVFAAKLLQLELTPEKRDRLMQAYLELKAWPEVPATLQSLKAAGLRLALLSNMTKVLLDTSIRNSGLDNIFESVLSTDAAKAHKPDPRAYQMGVSALKLRREEILFAAFAGWDAAGAKAFGYPTFWVNRMNLPAEELGVVADGAGQNLTELLKYATPSA